MSRFGGCVLVVALISGQWLVPAHHNWLPKSAGINPQKSREDPR